MTDTKAGRVLLDAIATNERLSPSGLRMAEYRQAVAAIEREAAQQEADRCVARGHLTALDLQEMKEQAKQQERERIRVRWDTESGDPTKHSAELCHATLNAILAEPSDD